MKNLLRVSYFLFAMTMFVSLFTSCKKDKNLPTPEPVIETPTTENTTTNDNVASLMTLAGGGGIENDSTNYCNCFDLFDDVDWTVSEAEIIAQLEAILVGLSEEEIEALFTPVCTLDGDFFENACVAECNGVTNYEECEYDYDDDIDWNKCFSFVYPVTLVFPNNSTQSVSTDDELLDAVEDWYDAHPNSDEDPTLQFPVDVILEADGSTLAINDDDELEDLFDACDDYNAEDCFTFVFPLEIMFPDSSIVAINSLDEGETIVEDWYDANPNVNEDVQLIYPIEVMLPDGTLKSINDEDELDDLFDYYDDCYDDLGCFQSLDSSTALIKQTNKVIQLRKTKK